MCKKVLWEREDYPNSKNPTFYIWTFKEKVRGYKIEDRLNRYICEKCLIEKFGFTKKEIYKKRFITSCNVCHKVIERYERHIKNENRESISICIGLTKKMYVPLRKGGSYCSKSCVVVDEV